MPLIFSIALGLLGGLVNIFSFPFLPEVELIFGNAAFILVASRYKPQYALLTMFITVTPLYFIWGHPFGYLTFGLEALIVALLRKRGMLVFYADIIYWFVIGIPLTCLIIWFNQKELISYIFFIGLKQAFNAALYTSIACLIIFLLDRRGLFKLTQQPQVLRGLRSQLVYAIVLIATFSLISFTLFISRNFIITTQQITSKTLNESATNFANIVNVYINDKKKAISLSANWLTQNNSDNNQSTILSSIHEIHDGFLTMLIADKHGELMAASPSNLMGSPEKRITLSVADRPYFQQAMQNKSTYLSKVFKGRGFGEDPIIAISAPFYENKNSKEPIGIVEGSLDLNMTSQISLTPLGEKTVSIILVDQFHKIIYASPSLNLIQLNKLAVTDISKKVTGKLLTINDGTQKFAYSKATLTNNWQVYALINNELSTKALENDYLVIFLTLLFTLIISAFIADRFAKRLTRPLNFIIKQLSKYNNKTIDDLEPLYFDAAKEISQVYDELISSKHKVLEHQAHLEEKVAERTKALHDANEKLEELALYDGLTQVHNRRFLDNNFTLVQKTAHRNTALMAMVMIDLDHFKKLNDSYGHLVGDQCLIKIAQLIKQEFCRDTDIVVRFGGEEFIVVAPYLTVAALQTKLENLRKTIEETLFTLDNGSTFSTSASFGALIADADYSQDVLKWVKLADNCLYLAKDTGRNKVVIEDKISRAN